MMYATLDDWREVAETNEIARYMPVAHHQARLVEQRRARTFSLCGTRHVGAAPIRDALHRFKRRGLLPVEGRPLSPKDIRNAVGEAGGVRPVYLNDADLALAKAPLLAEIGKAIDKQPLYLSTRATLTELRASWTRRQFEAAAPLLSDLSPFNLRATTEAVWANTTYMVLFLDLARVVYSHGQGEAVSLVQRQAVLDDFTRYAPEFESPSPEVFERLVHRRKYGSERVYQSELKTLRVRSPDERWVHEAPDLRSVRGPAAQAKRATDMLALPAPAPELAPTPEPEPDPPPKPPTRRPLIHTGSSAAEPARGGPVVNEDGMSLAA